MISERMRQARLASGFTLRELAARTGLVSAAAISKYETGKDVPRQRVLLAIARALGLPLDSFLAPPSVTLSVVEYRKRRSLPQSASETILARVTSDLEAYIELSELLGHRTPNSFDTSVALTETVTALDQADSYASQLRSKWNLGVDPIRNVTETVESLGVKVMMLNADDRFDELACVANGNHPVVVVKNLQPGKGDRQRFSILHGLGHLLLCPDGNIDKEKVCHRFAAAMLVPKEAAVRALGARRKDLDLDYEVPKLKEEFGMSIKVWVSRAYDLEIISDATRMRLFRAISQRGWNVNEPVDVPMETPSRFKLMVSQARAEGIISPLKAATYLGEFHRKIVPPISDGSVPDSAVDDYSPGGVLDSWSDIRPTGSTDV